MTSRRNIQPAQTSKGKAEHAEGSTSAVEPKGNHGVHKNGQSKTEGVGEGAASGIKFQINILVCLGMVAFLYFARAVILPILLAAVAAMVLKPVMKWLSRAHVPNVLGALLILGILLGGMGIGFVKLSEPAMNWIKDAPQDMVRLRQRADKFLPADKIKQAADSISQMPSGGATNKVPADQLSDHSGAGKAINWTAGLIGSTIETVVLLYMFLVLGDAFLNKVLDGNDAQEKRQALTMGREVQETISNYLLTISLINICLGTAVGAGLYFLGVPNAVMWGLMAALLNYIPYFGPIVGIIIVGIVSLLTFDTIPKSLLPAGWYLILHLAEADYITPVLLGRRFTISPLVVFISLLFGIWLWGILGALLSVPLLISLKVLCQRVPSLASGNRFL